eukprot:COSAG01_NODE_5758_length_4053_cov_12.093576_6_plen_87_part_00
METPRQVSVACYMSTLTIDYRPSTSTPIPNGGGGPAEGEQEWGPFVGLLDKPDLLQVRAPRPTQVLLTTRDQYHLRNINLMIRTLD